MPRRPNIASLSLDLDGCRFGDSPPPRGDQQRRQQQQHPGQGKSVGSQHQSRSGRQQRPTTTARRQAQEENRHPNQQQLQIGNQQHQHQQRQNDEHNPISSPLSTHHRDHLPQYNNSQQQQQQDDNDYHTPQQQRHDNMYPPSPSGTTYRFEGLSIGRDFLRFRGSTLRQDENKRSLRAEDLEVLECLGRGVCSSVWKAVRKIRSSNDDEDDGSRGGNDATNSTDPSQRQQQSLSPNNNNDEEEEDDTVDDSVTKYYALKIFPLRDPERRSMLVRELKLLCSFSCECLVELEGAFLDGGDDDDVDDRGSGGRSGHGTGGGGYGNTVTLVLEYMDRGSLESLTDRRHTGVMVPEYAIAAIAYQILWGLSYLHYEGVLHRDIKPANVLLSSSGRVKLADFGIVSKLPQQQQQQPTTTTTADINDSHDANDGTIMNHTVVGTTRYMSPERLHGRSYKKSSDVWGVGLVLLEIMRGCSPFEDVSSVVELVQTLDECTMAEFVPESTSDGLREILLGCLDHCPQKRIPASILLSSPWFKIHKIKDVEDAASLMRAYLDHH